MSKQLCLKWNHHTSNLLDFFGSLLSTEAFADVTLACDGLSLKAHKIVLSACSPFFKSLFLENPCKHPIVILKDIKYCDLKAMINFIYSGEVSVPHDQLLSFLLTAETLKVKGLEKITAENRHALGIGKEKNVNHSTVSTPISSPQTQLAERTTISSLPGKSKRASFRKRPLIDSSRSDEEGVAAKMKGRALPDLEEISSDSVSNITSNVCSGGGPNPSSLFMVSLHSLDNVISSSKSPAISRVSKITKEVNEFEVEPSSLLEQSLIIEDSSPNKQNNTVHVQLPSESDSEINRESISNTDVLRQTLDSTSDSILIVPDSPPDIKPEIDDLPIFPVAGTSRSFGRSATCMDHSGASKSKNSKKNSTVALNKSVTKGRVNKRKKQSKDKLPVVKTEPWKQILHMCSDCSYTNANIEELVSHVEYHNKTALRCEYCKIDFAELRSSEIKLDDGENVVECDICNHCFCSKMALLTHKLLHHY